MVAAARGGGVDRKPVIRWPGAGEPTDVRVVRGTSDAVRRTRAEVDTATPLLAEVQNPFGLALERGIDINQALRDDPEHGSLLLDGLEEEVRGRAMDSLGAGADGVLYRLHGAHPRHCTPMQYGGHYLERDRAILDSVREASFNLLFVVGDEETYFDFVSDLPAHAFGWDREASGAPVSLIRAMRGGALAASDPEADIELITGVPSVAAQLEAKPNAHV
jgi:hypothetical protein